MLPRFGVPSLTKTPNSIPLFRLFSAHYPVSVSLNPHNFLLVSAQWCHCPWCFQVLSGDFRVQIPSRQFSHFISVFSFNGVSDSSPWSCQVACLQLFFRYRMPPTVATVLSFVSWVGAPWFFSVSGIHLPGFPLKVPKELSILGSRLPAFGQ